MRLLSMCICFCFLFFFFFKQKSAYEMRISDWSSDVCSSDLQIMALFGQQAPETGAGLGLSATAAGFLLLPANFITAACYPFVARMVERHGPRLVGAIGFLMIVIGFGSLIDRKSVV